MIIVYETLESDPFAGIIETWDWTEKILCYAVPPGYYGMYWETQVMKDANVNDLIYLIKRGFYIKHVFI
jgi:hypothetical protein